MTLHLSISPAAEARLRAKAKTAGVDVESYAARELELLAQPLRSLREISGGNADAFAGGMAEDELADLLESEKHAARHERRTKRAG